MRRRLTVRSHALTMGTAALVYLSFFTTYHTRPYLTSAPEIDSAVRLLCPGLVARSLLASSWKSMIAGISGRYRPAWPDGGAGRFGLALCYQAGARVMPYFPGRHRRRHDQVAVICDPGAFSGCGLPLDRCR
jgi:hypothetical protein